MTLPDICVRKHGGNAQSVAANKSVHPRKPRQRESVLAYIAIMGTAGSTCEQAAIALGMRYTSVSARISELKQRGLVMELGLRRKTTGGESAAVLVCTGLNNAMPVGVVSPKVQRSAAKQESLFA